MAAGETVGRVAEALDGPTDLAVLFVSGRFCTELPAIVETVRSLLSPATLIGATAVGVLGGAQEVESGSAVSLWAGRTGPVGALRLESMPGQPPQVYGLPDELADGSVVLAVCDPFTLPVDTLARQANDHPARPSVVGGLASAGGAPGSNTLVLDGDLHRDGGVGVVLPPGVARPVVSQGCRPIGDPWVVTRSEGQLIHELAGRPALERVSELVERLDPADRALAAQGLHIGVVADEQQARFGQGDFLIRAVLGADRNTGAVAIGDAAEVGRVVQFQVRDEASASAELHRLTGAVEGRSALVFTCNGRGSHLFSRPNHDAEAVYESVGDAVAGMFCAGEMGPIAGRNAVHGFTATMAVFA